MAKLDVMTKSDLKVISALMNRAPARVADMEERQCLVPTHLSKLRKLIEREEQIKQNYVFHMGDDYISTPIGA